jgi:hypothetical protein
MTNQCDHGQLARSCLLCEMRDENLALRAQVAELTTAQKHWFDTAQSYGDALVIASDKLADCQAVIKKRGHDADCSVHWCSYPVRGHLCGYIAKAHAELPIGHEFKPGPCSAECGHDRTTGEKV